MLISMFIHITIIVTINDTSFQHAIYVSFSFFKSKPYIISI